MMVIISLLCKKTTIDESRQEARQSIAVLVVAFIFGAKL